MSGYDSRLYYLSLPPISDQSIKNYLLGPLNGCLKKMEGCRLFDEPLAEWFIDKFGGNFVDMRSFIERVMKAQNDPEQYLSACTDRYGEFFSNIWKYPDGRAILDILAKDGKFSISHLYDMDTLTYSLQKNIVGRRATVYTWNKRLVRVAYERFAEKQKRLSLEASTAQTSPKVPQ